MPKTSTKWIRSPADEMAVAAGCYFDERAAAHVVEFFRKYLRHSKGKWAGKPFELIPWQRKDVIYPLFGWFREDKTRRYRKSFIEIPKKNGKALALTTPIPTPTGWTTIGEIQVGDTVFDETGKQCRVTAMTEIMHDRPCYELTFSDGCKIIADENHEWLTRTRKPELKTLIWETWEIAETLRIESPGSEGANHSVVVADWLETKEAYLPIHPYALGAWLGDGNSASARLTCSKKDTAVVDRLVAVGVPVQQRESCNEGSNLYQLGSYGKTQTARDLSMQATLRRMGILRNKHIPCSYLRASQGQRLELLRGLLDTDGYATPKGQIEYTTISEQLRDGTMELIRSLGFKANCVTGRAMLRGKDCGPKYRITFWPSNDERFFWLERKQARLKGRKTLGPRSRSRQIISADRVSSVPVRCIQVDSVSRLFLAGESMIPTHNSTIAAGIGLYLLVADGEAGAEVFSAAADRDQASIVHGEAIHMVEASEALQSVLRINQTTKTITFEKTKSMYRALSSEAESKEGLNASGIIVDELHVWYGRKLWDALKYAGRARSQPLTFVITTAGDDPLSVCREQYDYAKGVLAGTVNDDRFFAYIREADPADDWMDPKVWRKANPSLGITINEADFAADMLEASKTPTTQASAKRYSLNIWATATNPWLRIEDWHRCREDYIPGSLFGQACHAGLDLAKTRDMTALVLVFRGDDGTVRLLPYFWLPEAAVHDPDKPEEYRVWAREGLLEVTPGNVCDYGFITKRVIEIKDQFDLRELGYDPYNAEQLTQELEAEHDVKRVAFPQTIQNFADPTKEFERLLLGGKLKHNGNPILTWQAGNVSVKTDPSGNIRPVKPPQGDPRKIDGIVAAIMGLARSMLDTEQPVEAGMWLIGGDD